MHLEQLTLAVGLENGQQGAWVGAGAGRQWEVAAGIWKRGGGCSPGCLAVEIEGYGWTDRGGVLEEEMPRHVAGLVMGLGCFAS